ncbi:hypothetical protein [Nocardia altamirensis]|nr:hypothetical protein [Nocardia altamirensis]
MSVSTAVRDSDLAFGFDARRVGLMSVLVWVADSALFLGGHEGAGR